VLQYGIFRLPFFSESHNQALEILKKKLGYVFLKPPDGFDVHVTMHRDKFLIIKPTRCTDFSNLFWKFLYVSDSSSVHHQEFFTVNTAMVYVIQVC